MITIYLGIFLFFSDDTFSLRYKLSLPGVSHSIIENICSSLAETAKGQLISKCPYENSVSSKIPTKIFLELCPETFCSFLGAS